jgi:methionine synthase I (cobalamin-dependent)
MGIERVAGMTKAKVDENKQYEDVCRPQFEQILKAVEKTHKKLFESNGERALVELVRDNTQEAKRISEKVNDHLEEEKKRPKSIEDWLRDSGRGGLILGIIYLILKEHGIDLSQLFLP